MNLDRCDIVIPVWNNLEMTRDCIDSIIRHTAYPYRLVIVDNASDLPARDYLDSLKRSRPNEVAVIRNERNEGFVKAVNKGMRHSDAAYICVMNNDTIATEGWLGEIIKIFHGHEDIGIVNPSSNTSCQFPGALDVQTYAMTLKALSGRYQELYTGRAFAMVIKRQVVDRIGYLDEIYGMGYFDDTDYCKRAQAFGYRCVRAKASYVYHKESQSFSKVKERSAIFLENEKKFTKKWGRYLRIAYVIPDIAKKEGWIASNINKMARMGHQVWIFTTAHQDASLDLIDHEGIRFFYLPEFLFNLHVLYKIWRRRKKKPLHVILTSAGRGYDFFRLCKDALGAEIFHDGDFPSVAQALDRMAGCPLQGADIAGI